MNFLGSSYKEIEDNEWFPRIEEAILTSCHICGTELEWEIKIKWNDKSNLPELFGAAFSCGCIFIIEPNDDGYITKIISMQ